MEYLEPPAIYEQAPYDGDSKNITVTIDGVTYQVINGNAQTTLLSQTAEITPTTSTTPTNETASHNLYLPQIESSPAKIENETAAGQFIEYMREKFGTTVTFEYDETYVTKFNNGNLGESLGPTAAMLAAFQIEDSMIRSGLTTDNSFAHETLTIKLTYNKCDLCDADINPFRFNGFGVVELNIHDTLIDNPAGKYILAAYMEAAIKEPNLSQGPMGQAYRDIAALSHELYLLKRYKDNNWDGVDQETINKFMQYLYSIPVSSSMPLGTRVILGQYGDKLGANDIGVNAVVTSIIKKNTRDLIDLLEVSSLTNDEKIKLLTAYLVRNVQYPTDLKSYLDALQKSESLPGYLNDTSMLPPEDTLPVVSTVHELYLHDSHNVRALIIFALDRRNGLTYPVLNNDFRNMAFGVFDEPLNRYLKVIEEPIIIHLGTNNNGSASVSMPYGPNVMVEIPHDNGLVTQESRDSISNNFSVEWKSSENNPSSTIFPASNGLQQSKTSQDISKQNLAKTSKAYQANFAATKPQNNQRFINDQIAVMKRKYNRR